MIQDSIDLTTFIRTTGIGVVFVDNLKDLDPKHELSDKTLSRPVVGRYDSNENRIYIYIDQNMAIDPGITKNNVANICLYNAVKNLGLFGLLKSTNTVSHMVKGIDGLEKAFLSDPITGRYLAHKELAENQYTARVVASRLGDLLDLSTGQSSGKMLELAQGAYNKSMSNKANVSRDFSEVSHNVLAQIDAKVNKNFIPIGKASEPYLRVDYPEIDILLDINRLHRLFSNTELGDNFVKDIQDPLAIIRSVSKKGHTSVLVITGNVMPNGDFLCLNLFEPGKVTNDYDIKENAKSILARPFRMSAQQVSDSIRYCKQNDEPQLKRKRQDNEVMFMKEVQTSLGINKFVLFPTLVDALKKGEARNSPVLDGLRSLLLNSVDANIRRNFSNPKNSEEYLRLYGKTRNPLRDKREERAAMAAENKRLDDEKFIREHKAKETPTETPTKAASSEWDLSYPLPAKLVSEDKWKKLEKNGITDTKRLKEAGYDAVKKLVGAKATETLFAYHVPYTRRFSSESEFNALSTADKDKELRTNLGEILSRMPVEVESMKLFMPSGRDGSLFDGEAGALLLGKSITAGKRWERCPYFFTSKELAVYGFEPKDEIYGINIKHDGEYKTVYNLSDTTMKTDNKVIFDKYMESVQNETHPQATSYIRSLMWALRSPGYVDKNAPLAQTTVLFNNEIQRQTVKNVLSFKDAITPELHDALVADASKSAVYLRYFSPAQQESTSPAQESGEKISEDTGERIVEKPNLAAQAEKKLSERELITIWFSNLPPEMQLKVIGYTNIQNAWEDLFKGKPFPGKDNINPKEVSYALNGQFTAKNDKEREEIFERSIILSHISDYLRKEGVYDISSAGIMVGQFHIKNLEVKNIQVNNTGETLKAVTFTFAQLAHSRLTPVRDIAFSIDQIKDVCKTLNVDIDIPALKTAQLKETRRTYLRQKDAHNRDKTIDSLGKQTDKQIKKHP